MKNRSNRDPMTVLAYLAYLVTCQRLSRPQTNTTERVLLRLITIAGAVLGILILSAADAPEHVGDLLQHWPILP